MSGKNTANSEAIAFLHGYFEAKIEGFAISAGIPASELTIRLGALFLRQKSGEILGTENNMPKLRRNTTKKYKTARKMAMVKRSSSKSSYWEKMTPEERSKEVIRRREVAKKKIKK